MKIKENSTTELSYLKCLQKLFDNCPWIYEEWYDCMYGVVPVASMNSLYKEKAILMWVKYQQLCLTRQHE
jgi:hypothetical protein